MVKKYKLLIDTDPGVDDALAIMLAHKHADIVGLTIAAGNVGLSHTVANALKLIDVIGAETPVFAGCAQPLVLPAADAAFVHGDDGFGDTGYLASTRKAQNEHAADAILRLSHEHAGELMIACIAPLTNLALALRLDPTLPQRIAKLVVMGGAVTGRGNTHLVPAEFNIGFDPEAAHVVFSSWPNFKLVDWELTVRHGIDFDVLDKWLSTGSASAKFYDAISAKTRAWTVQRGRPRLMVADALALAVALEPDIVRKSERRHVAIELTGALTRGATVVDWDRRLGHSENAEIVLDLDQSRVESLIAGALA
ncbi:MAG: nucleoside hydrolase [Rudaea sp.]